ncbi:ATP-binding protein [Campylobacter blaseri]|nr:ATP-binding protein [Campylobacter blaseri]
MKHNQISQLKNTLQSQANLIEITLNSSNLKDLQKLAKQVKKANSYRLTIIDKDGVVLAESNDIDIKQMENHSFRNEILDAKEKGIGSDIRYSKTLNVDFLYLAKDITYNGEDLYIRLAVSIKKIEDGFFAIWLKIGIIFAFALLISFILSYLLNKKISFEINKILAGLNEISEKSYKTRINSKFATEFVEISEKIHALADKLAKRDKQKRKHAAKLRLANRQKDDIISAISHEFKNPITIILGYASSLQEDLENQEIRNKFLEKIKTNASKLSKMIDRLALTTKIENGNLKTHKTNFDIALLLADIVVVYKEKYSDRNFILETKSKFINADKTMIEMVICNLLDNAIKYSQDDILIKQTSSKCSIIDYGAGIDENELSKITKKFYRCDNFSWNNSLGLGLYIVNYLLKLNDSKLVIESKLDEGSTFSFELLPS